MHFIFYIPDLPFGVAYLSGNTIFMCGTKWLSSYDKIRAVIRHQQERVKI